MKLFVYMYVCLLVLYITMEHTDMQYVVFSILERFSYIITCFDLAEPNWLGHTVSDILDSMAACQNVRMSE